MMIYLHIIYTDEHNGAITIIKVHKLDSVNFFRKKSTYTHYIHMTEVHMRNDLK